MIRGLVLGAFVGGIIACASGGQRAAVAPTATGAEPPHAPVMGDDLHAQITALENDIKANHGAFVEGDAMATALVPMTVAPQSTDEACHPAPTPTCTDSCKLSDAICKDAKSICDLAAQLPPNDHWAAGKCESGKTSCTESHKSCCDCR